MWYWEAFRGVERIGIFRRITGTSEKPAWSNTCDAERSEEALIPWHFLPTWFASPAMPPKGQQCFGSFYSGEGTGNDMSLGNVVAEKDSLLTSLGPRDGVALPWPSFDSIRMASCLWLKS